MATMDETRPQTTPENPQAPDFDGARSERRRRAHDILATQRSYLDRLENALSEGLDHLAGEISREWAISRAEQSAASEQGAADLQPQLDELRQKLAAQQAELEQTRHTREQLQVEAGRLEQELRVRDALLREAQAQHEQRHAELAASREQLASLQSQWTAAQERQEQLRQELADERERSSAAQEETKAQRRRIARGLKTQHAERIDELDRRKAELKVLEAARNTQLEAQVVAAETAANQARSEATRLGAALEQHTRELEQARGAVASLEHELGQAHKALQEAQDAQQHNSQELDRVAAKAQADQQELADARATIEALTSEATQLREALEKTLADQERRGEELNRLAKQGSGSQQELADARATIEALTSEAEQLREALEKVVAAQARDSDELNRSAEQSSASQQELVALRHERDSLLNQLAAAEDQLREALEATGSKPTDRDDLERRLEMAVQELREMKRLNMDLEVKLTKARSAGSASAPAPGASLDWEAQKQRLLASLEADEPEDEEAIAERNTIEGTIRITDQIVAQKDEEIAELRQQLENQPDQLRSSVATAEAVAELLDRDEVIRQEREKLEQVQAEWREKIGKAETEISLERARIARERAELAEKMQRYSQPSEDRGHAGDQSAPATPVRGRWLTMLGLKDIDDKHEK